MSEAYTGEYAAIRAQALACMRDACKVGVRSAPVSDDPGDVTYTYGAEIACGIEISTRGEVDNGSQVTLTDIVCRLPWGTAIADGSRIQITKQAGATVSTDNVYAVDGAPYGNLACVRARLKRLTGASVL